MENVMLNMSNDRIKIVDFGLSNIYTTETPLRTHCGSPEYAAPELFVEGKHYGPEVDLWSLGVILYGMVIGQLPFVSSSRDGHVASHQQRRKRLLEQINKGLSAPHRKALALLSMEFRTMMARLLVPDSTKRINITELIFHPWVTEKGRKSVRSNPLKKLDAHWQTNVAKDVAVLTSADWMEVQNAIKAEPHGNIAGMYNLIAYSKMDGSLEFDPIMSKNLTSHYTTPRSAVNKVSTVTSKCAKPRSPTKRLTILKSAPVHKVSNISQTPATPKRLDIPIRPSTLAKTMMDKPPPKTKTRASSSSKPTHTTKNNGINLIPLSVKPIRKSTVRVHSYSRSVTSIIDDKSKTCNASVVSRKSPIVATYHLFDVNERLASPNILHNLHKSPAGDASNKNSYYENYEDLVYTMNVPAQNTRSKKNMMEAINSTHKRTLRIHSANVEVPTEAAARASQESAQARRPLTTGPTHTAERAAKRRSMLPVLMSRPATSKGAASGGVVSTPTKVQKAATANRRATPERSDDFKKTLTTPVKSKMDFSNEPIARSIAGYVTKNVSHKLEPLKWIKGAKINLST